MHCYFTDVKQWVAHWNAFHVAVAPVDICTVRSCETMVHPHPLGGCMRAASMWRPWVSGLVGHFVQIWPDSELLSHGAVLRL